MKKNLQNSKGQAMITVLFIMLIGMLITMASVITSINNATSTTNSEIGVTAYDLAESGAENALLKLIRNPNYTGEQYSPSIGQTITITVTGVSPQIITSEGKIGTIAKRIQINLQYNDGVLVINSWKETQ